MAKFHNQLQYHGSGWIIVHFTWKNICTYWSLESIPYIQYLFFLWLVKKDLKKKDQKMFAILQTSWEVMCNAWKTTWKVLTAPIQLWKIRYHEILLMVQKSGIYQLIWKNIPVSIRFHTFQEIHFRNPSISPYHPLGLFKKKNPPKSISGPKCASGPGSSRWTKPTGSCRFPRAEISRLAWSTRIPKKHLKISELYENNIY